MLQEEIFVAPLLEARIKPAVIRRQRLLAGAVEMAAVVGIAIVRGQVHAAPKPPHRLGIRLHRQEAAHVHMDRGHIGVARVEHQ
ncbi:hypothetical protein D3C72_2185350 [compost metagenome]